MDNREHLEMLLYGRTQATFRDWALFKRASDEVESLRAEVERLTAQLAAVTRERDEFIEREASCCPEDVGCDEYIKTLKSRIAELGAAGDQLDLSVAFCLSQYLGKQEPCLCRSCNAKRNWRQVRGA